MNNQSQVQFHTQHQLTQSRIQLVTRAEIDNSESVEQNTGNNDGESAANRRAREGQNDEQQARQIIASALPNMQNGDSVTLSLDVNIQHHSATQSQTSTGDDTQTPLESDPDENSPDYIRKLILQKLFNQEQIESAEVAPTQALRNKVAEINAASSSFTISNLTSLATSASLSMIQPHGMGAQVPFTGEAIVIEPRPISQVNVLDIYHEQESLSFSAEGQMTLDNGEQVQFALAQEYSREFIQLETYQRPEFVDPLVVNLGNGPISFSDQQHQFDIDADGELDNIYQLNSDSAFLAIDHNGNGKIDDGSELIGAMSGNAFAELAAYDDNQDGVINSHDEIFESLVLWQYGEAGESLEKASERGINTLLLSSADTQYTFTNEHNQALAQMRRSSVYANSDGSVGSLHQVDLVV